MLKWSLAVAATLGIGNAAWAAESQRPNVLFMIVDDLNGWIGCLAPGLGAQTPQIDRLASRGTLFGNAHCAAPVCNPSRTALLTGLRPSTSGIYDNLQAGSLPDHATDPREWKNLADDAKYDAVRADLRHRLPDHNAPRNPNENKKSSND